MAGHAADPTAEDRHEIGIGSSRAGRAERDRLMQRTEMKFISVTAAVAAVTALSGCTGSPGNSAAAAD
jgi:hypothetical protein